MSNVMNEKKPATFFVVSGDVGCLLEVLEMVLSNFRYHPYETRADKRRKVLYRQACDVLVRAQVQSSITVFIAMFTWSFLSMTQREQSLNNFSTEIVGPKSG